MEDPELPVSNTHFSGTSRVIAYATEPPTSPPPLHNSVTLLHHKSLFSGGSGKGAQTDPPSPCLTSKFCFRRCRDASSYACASRTDARPLLLKSLSQIWQERVSHKQLCFLEKALGHVDAVNQFSRTAFGSFCPLKYFQAAVDGWPTAIREELRSGPVLPISSCARRP